MGGNLGSTGGSCLAFCLFRSTRSSDPCLGKTSRRETSFLVASWGTGLCYGHLDAGWTFCFGLASFAALIKQPAISRFAYVPPRTAIARPCRNIYKFAVMVGCGHGRLSAAVGRFLLSTYSAGLSVVLPIAKQVSRTMIALCSTGGGVFDGRCSCFFPDPDPRFSREEVRFPRWLAVGKGASTEVPGWPGVLPRLLQVLGTMGRIHPPDASTSGICRLHSAVLRFAIGSLAGPGRPGRTPGNPTPPRRWTLITLGLFKTGREISSRGLGLGAYAVSRPGGRFTGGLGDPVWKNASLLLPWDSNCHSFFCTR